ncbi:prion protein b [Chanodichthys erythropterus]|uniref:prion protein b n=1 Tax=Chanodichthys erythropterus TaxID=933992 RepID=UPI00351E4757
MGLFCKLVLLILVLMAVLHNSSGGKKGFGGKSTPSKKPSDKPSQGTKTQPNYPRQPSHPGAGRNPGYPNQYPGRGGSNPGGYPHQNPGTGSYPAGGNPNQYPGRGGVSPGGYPNQNPGAGTYPAGGSYPSAGGSPNQYPGRGGSNPGGYPNQNPGAGTYPAGGSYPSAGGNPNQYPGRGGVNPGGYPNQNPGAGGFSNQYPGRSGYSPGGYPAAGFYPVRTAGQPGGYPGGHPSIGGGYPNWNPNNKILSPRYGGSFGGGGFGMGGSPFSQTVRGMGYGPSVQSKGFAKKAMLAAGVGAMAGMAVGYGIGNFPRPNFQFRSHQEERHYNNYMYQHHGTHSKGGNNKRGPSYTSKLPPQAQSYDQFMNTCLKQSDLLKEQNMKDSSVRNNIQRDEPLTDYLSMNEEKGELEKNDTASPTAVIDPKDAGIHNDEDDDTVSIIEIGYPALIEQMKTRKCVEQYLVYSESFPEKQKEKSFGNHNGHSVSGVLLFLTTSFMLFRGT